MEHWVRARFTPPTPLGRDGRRVTASREHIEVSKNAAKEGMVLLKNKGHVLPLAKGSRVALFGKGTIDYVKGGGGSGDVTTPYVHNIYDGFMELQKDGIVSVFDGSAEFYKKYTEDEYKKGSRPGLIKEPEVPEDLLNAAAAFTDTAVISISRFSGEGWDRKSGAGDAVPNLCDDRETIAVENELFKRADFYLTDEEDRMIKTVCSRFCRVIVVMNVGGMVDTSWFRDNDAVSGALMAWQGGMEGGLAEAELLMGIGNPSGKLADTFAEKLEDYPSTAGFHEAADHVDYTEDIYVGYRYFETLPGAGKKVVYPFGFGLSYTTFALQPVMGETSPGEDIFVQVQVTNTGRYAGREVVQLYYGAPQGKLGKPARALIRYQKTGLLQPGQSEQITFRLNADEMASYDDLGHIRKSSWVLEKGSYHFYLGTDVESAKLLPFSYERKEDKTVKTLTPRLVPHKLAKRLLADGTWEDLLQDPSWAPEESGLEMMTYEEQDSAGPRVRPAVCGVAWKPAKRMQFTDVADGKASLDEFIATLSDEDLTWLVGGQPNTACANTFGWGNLEEAGIPNIMTADGPAGVRFYPATGVKTTAFPCATLLSCTWDPQIVYEVGRAGGQEAKENNIYAWLTPAVNIHRSALCGRNFEYYSEDPYLAGKQASAMVEGIQSQHVCAVVKHFALNNKEMNRKYSDSRTSERAIREIYLKQFEIIVKEAHPWAVMTSYNLVNGCHTSANADLLEGILREEWGFDGMVTTDWWTTAEHYLECSAGNDVKMGCGYPERLQEALDKGLLTRKELEAAVRNILTLILRVDD